MTKIFVSSPKISIMKKITPILIISLFITTSCSDIFEKQLDIYKDATKELKKTDDFTSVMNEAINTEVLISQLLANATDEEREELKEDYGEDYGHMLDSIETVRNKYYSDVDSLFLGYTYNFVERRILLYKIAADRYCKAEYIKELNAIKELIKRYSKLSFVDSQRSCDPPAKIREEYERTKDLAESCFDVAKKSILDKENEEDKKE